MGEVVELGLRLSTKELKEAQGEFDKTGRAAKRTQEELDKTGKASERMNQQIAGLIRQLKTLFGGYLGLQGIRQIIAMSDAWKLLEGRLKLVTDGTQNLIGVQNALFDVAQRTRSSFEATVQLYSRVATSSKNLGMSQRDLIQFTELVNKALQVGGATTAEAAAGVIQLSQALAAGVLRGDEFRSVLENMPRVAKALEEGLGKTRGELIQMAADGKLTSKAVADALMSQFGVIDAEYKKLSVTVGQAFTVFNNEFLKYIGTNAAVISMTNGLASAMILLSKNTGPVIEALGFLTAAYLVTKIGTLTAAIKTLTLAMLNNPFIILVTAIASLIVWMGGLQKTFLAFKGVMTVVAGEVVKFANTGVSIFQAFTAGVEGAFERCGAIVAAFSDDLQAFVLNPLKGADFSRTKAEIEKGFVGGFTEAFDKVMKESEEFNKGIDEDVTASLQVLKQQMEAIDKAAADPGGTVSDKRGVVAPSVDADKLKQLKKAKEIIDSYLTSLKQEVNLAGLTVDERERLTAIYQLENQLKEQGVKLDEQTRAEVEALVARRQEITKTVEMAGKMADDMESSFKDGFKALFTDGVGGMDKMLDSWNNMLIDWISDFITKQYFRPIFDALANGLASSLSGGGGGGLLSSIGGFFGIGGSGATSQAAPIQGLGEISVTDLPSAGSFADGGSFTVGGTGGIDSQNVRFKATPGENFTVRSRSANDNNSGGGKTEINIINNAPKADVRVEEKANGNGGKSIEVIVDEVTARNVRKTGSATQKAMRDTFGVNQTLATRG